MPFGVSFESRKSKNRSIRREGQPYSSTTYLCFRPRCVPSVPRDHPPFRPYRISLLWHPCVLRTHGVRVCEAQVIHMLQWNVAEGTKKQWPRSASILYSRTLQRDRERKRSLQLVRYTAAGGKINQSHADTSLFTVSQMTVAVNPYGFSERTLEPA